MKKIIALILVAVMLTALASCVKNPDNESTSSSSSTSATTESTKNEQTTETTETTTANNPVTPPEKKELADIISATYEKHPISIGVSTEQLDPSEMDADTIRYLASVTGVDKISEFCVSGPLMAPPAYEMVVVRVKNASDAEAVAKEMLENSDPGKWICVRAEAVRIGVCGDTIMMVMSSAEEAGALISAFGEVCGGLTLTLEK
jgi:hypothetical protein